MSSQHVAEGMGMVTRHQIRRPWFAILCACAPLLLCAVARAQVCVGDCNGDGRMTANEILLAVESACPAADTNGDSQIERRPRSPPPFIVCSTSCPRGAARRLGRSFRRLRHRLDDEWLGTRRWFALGGRRSPDRRGSSTLRCERLETGRPGFPVPLLELGTRDFGVGCLRRRPQRNDSPFRRTESWTAQADAGDHSGVGNLGRGARRCVGGGRR